MGKVLHPVSDQDKEQLYKYARKWQDLLSLHRWRLTPSNLPTNAMAELKFSKDNSHKLVKLLVGKHFGAEKVTAATLEMTAIHELIHILLYDYGEVCKESPYDTTRIMEAEHAIVHVLEKLLYELWHCKHVEITEDTPVHRSRKKPA